MNAEERAQTIVKQHGATDCWCEFVDGDWSPDGPCDKCRLLIAAIAAALQEAEPVDLPAKSDVAPDRDGRETERDARMTAIKIAWSYSGYLNGRLCERLAEEIEAALLGKWPPLKMPADRTALIERAVQADDGTCSTGAALEHQAPAPSPARPPEGVTSLVAEWRRLLALATAANWSCVAVAPNGYPGVVFKDGDWHVFKAPWDEALIPLARLYHSDDHDAATRERSGHDARLIVWMRNHADEIIAALDAAHRERGRETMDADGGFGGALGATPSDAGAGTELEAEILDMVFPSVRSVAASLLARLRVSVGLAARRRLEEMETVLEHAKRTWHRCVTMTPMSDDMREHERVLGRPLRDDDPVRLTATCDTCGARLLSSPRATA